MAIRMMTSREDFERDPQGVEVVRDYPGHEEGVRHAKDCPHYTNGQHDRSMLKRSPECMADRFIRDGGNCDEIGPLYMRTTHVGLVLNTRERNGYDDSDFYADVWDPIARKVDSVCYASTRGWTYSNDAVVDATPEVLAAYAAWRAEVQEAARAYAAAEEAKRVSVGKQVRFLGTGTKHGYKQGDTGEVIKMSASPFRTYYRNGYNRPEHNMRALVRMLTGAMVWVDAQRVEVVQ